jgi:hypothetical protein
MLNLNQVWNEEVEAQLVKENLLALQKFLNKLNNDDDWENPHTYQILEYYPKVINNVLTYISNQYKLINLKIDGIEDGIVIFDDAEGILVEAIYKGTPLPLQTIVIDDILMIGHVDNIVTISTSFGYIKIEY